MDTKINVVDGIMRYEAGEMTEDEVVVLFQHLADTKMLYQLQGHYVRMGKTLADAGLISL
jgi:hypothetical protein